MVRASGLAERRRGGIQIYADCASLEQIERYATNERVSGFTTNPSLMKKAGIKNYRAFAKTVLGIVKDKAVSFEVLADDVETIEKQAREIASWGENVWVKIPITSTKGPHLLALIDKLAVAQPPRYEWREPINLNVTAVMTARQIISALDFLKETDILSIFVGRITDTGVSALQALSPALAYKRYSGNKARILWASAREIYNYYQAKEYGVDIITLTPELIEKLPLEGKDLGEYSLETVRQFHQDGQGIEF